MMPPICPGKQRNGDQKNSQPEEYFLRFEHEEEQQNPDQHRTARRQVVRGKSAKKIFDLVHGGVFIVLIRSGDDT
jgi:hypothetical protein